MFYVVQQLFLITSLPMLPQTENAGLENAAPSTMQGWKMQDQTSMESQDPNTRRIAYLIVTVNANCRL